MANRRSFRVPQEIKDNVTKGLALQKEWKRGKATLPDSIDLVEDAGISIDCVRKLFLTFQPLEETVDKNFVEEDGGPSAEAISWELNGGDAGNKWINRIIKIEGRKNVGKVEGPLDASFIKVEESLGLVMGFAIISTYKGVPYFDLQGDHIPEESMLKASVDFMQNSRVTKEMHGEEENGTVVFAWPMTDEIAKAFSIHTETTGLMIAMKPDSDEILEKFRSGEYTGFSIGGNRIEDKEVEDDIS